MKEDGRLTVLQEREDPAAAAAGDGDQTRGGGGLRDERRDMAFNQPSSLSCTFLPFLLEVGGRLADEVAGGLGLASEVAGGGGPASVEHRVVLLPAGC